MNATGGTDVSVRGRARTRRVLVARLDSMGDVIVSGPAIRAIAARARVTLLTGPQGAAAGELLPGVEDVAVWECPWILDPAPRMSDGLVSRLTEIVQSRQLTEAVILTSFHQSPLPLALLLRLAGVQWISGASVDHAGSLLDFRLRPDEDLSEDVPEPQRAVAIAAGAGFPSVDDGRLRLGPLPDTSALTGAGRYIVLHPGAAMPSRRWPIRSFARTAALLAVAGKRVVVTGGTADRAAAAAVCAAAERAATTGTADGAGELRAVGDRGRFDRLSDRATAGDQATTGDRGAAGVAVNLAGACSLAELAGVIAGADAIIVGNTGPAHLAAAVGTPVVSLFSPVVPAERWAPYGVPVALFGDQQAACRGSRARACPVAGHPCLAGVPAEEVAAAAIRFADASTAQPAGPGTHEAEPLRIPDAAATRTAAPGTPAPVTPIADAPSATGLTPPGATPHRTGPASPSAIAGPSTRIENARPRTPERTVAL